MLRFSRRCSFGADWDKSICKELAVLVVGCPCALVISTPVAIVTAIGNAARNGVLIKGGIHLEEMAAIKAIAFDKTGTLTEGVPVVTDYLPLENTNRNELFAIITALEHGSQHPLASAIVNKAIQENIIYKDLEITEFTSITGKGISGKVNDTVYHVGSSILFEDLQALGTPADLRKIKSDYSKSRKNCYDSGNRN